MHILINTIPSGYDAKTAERYAADFNSGNEGDDDDWKAVVRHEAKWSFVDIYDEDGEKVGGLYT